MGWTDKLGDAWDSVTSATDTAWDFSHIGAAYSATADSAVGDAIGVVVKPVGSLALDTAEALTYPLDRVKRGLSTGGLMADRANGVSIFDPDAWEKAWKSSEDLSIGQNAITSLRDDLDIGGEGDANFSSGQFMAADPANDPYTGEKAAKAADFYKNTWSGRLSSGAVDLVIDFTLDPLIVGGKAGKVALAANRSIKPAEAAGALAQATGGAGATAREVNQGNKLKALFTKTDNLSAAEMSAMPEFRASGDAGAIAHFFESANKLHPADEAARHAAKADVFGAVLGDAPSIKRLKDTADELAEQIRLMGSPPVQMEAIARYDGTDFGATMLKHFNEEDPRLVGKLTEEHLNEYSRLERVLTAAGSSGKVASGPLERLGQAGRVEKITGAKTQKLTESIIPNGIGGMPMRFVVGQASTRIPGAINIKDASKGFDEMTSVVGAMRHTDPLVRRGIMDDWTNAATEIDRRAVVDKAESIMFRDAAKKYNISESAAKQFLDQAQGRRGAYNQGLSDRLYSAADEDRLISFVDPEDGMKHVFEKAFLQTHIQDNHMVTDPKVIDQFLKRGTNRRLLERWAEGTPLESASSGVSGAASATADTLDNWLTMSTRVWKDAALMRLAYPLRIQVDSQLRVMSHLGMMKYFMDGKFTGMSKHVLQDADGQFNLKNLINGTVFKGGKYEASLSKSLKKGEEYKGVATNPALDDEGVQRIVASFESRGGAAADLGNDISAATQRAMRKDGSWGKTKPDDPNWFASWKRAADQIRTSPTARQALVDDDIESLTAWVQKDPKALAEWNNFKKSHGSIEEWLTKIVAHNDHVVPTPELRQRIDKPDTAEELFGIGAAQQRGAAVPDLKVKRDEAEQAVKDLQDRIKSVKERQADDPDAHLKKKIHQNELKELNGRLKGLRNERWQARAEHGDAKKGISPGTVGEDGLVEPMPIHGESISPLVRNSWAEKWEDFRHGWYTWAADAPETIMARSPIYADSFRRYVKDSVDRLGDDGVDLIGADRIRSAADRAARKEVATVLFDATHTSNLAHSMRFISPFFSAWEDSMKKWSKLMANDPQIAPNLAKAWQAPDNAGIVQDSEGNNLRPGEKAENGRGEYIVIPKIKGLERIIPGNVDDKGKDSGMFKIRKDGLNILFQGEPPWLPGNGPLVQLPANAIVKSHFVKEADNPVIKYLLPFGVTDDPMAYQLLPSWAKQIADSGVGPFGTTKDFNQQYVILYNQEYGRYVRGERKSEPDDKEIGGKTKQWFLLRAGINNASPVSMQPVPKDQFYIDKAHQYAADPARKGHWQEDFYDDFPGYFEMSTTLSVNETGLQATNAAYDAGKKYAGDIKKDPSLGWFFAGNDNLTGEFNPNVNTYQRSTIAGQGKTYRSQKDPMLAIKSAQEEKGWIEYNKVATAIDLELEKRGLVNIQQTGAEDLATAKRLWVDTNKAANPDWAEAFGPGKADQRREKLVSIAKEKWSKDKEFAARPDQVILKQFLDSREQMQQILAQRTTSTLASQENQDLAQAWGLWTNQLKRSNPAFEQIYNRVFESDELGQVFR